jgi:hypothetical protein
MKTYQRTSSIERSDGMDKGFISGTLVTDGEASDGHILNIAGGELPERAPLLFGHDDYTGTGNLGSWTSFRKEVTKGGSLGDSRIRGDAQIELEGEGSQLAWRQDIDHMIEKGHIGQFSVRWADIEDPVQRINLPSDHPAFIDSKKAKGRQRWGLYFDKWKLLEGSVVTLGADPAALIGKMQQAEGDVRHYWRSAVNHALTETHETADLVGVFLADGSIAYVERAAWEAMLQEANSRCSIAIELHEDANATLRMAHDLISTRDDTDPEVWADAIVERIRSKDEQAEAREDSEETQLELKDEAAPLPAREVITPRQLIDHLGQELDQAWRRVNLKKRAKIEEARGRVVHDG